jgi:predicted RecB family nuclease
MSALAARSPGANAQTASTDYGQRLCPLPRRDPSDIFLDMEGYPFFDDGNSLEYLFGFVTVDDEHTRFAALWAHDRQAERRVFERPIDFITARLEKLTRKPSSTNIEETALKRLAMIHGSP